MYGLLKLFYLLAYVALAGWLLYKIKPIWGKALVLVVTVLIPNADDWYYRNKLTKYCANEAGFRIYKEASQKEGLVDQMTSAHGEGWLQHLHISYMQWPETVGNSVVGYWRADRMANGTISGPYKIATYNASYEKTRVEEKTYPFTAVYQRVVDRRDGTVLGEFRNLYYYGGWYPRALTGQGGLVAACGSNGQMVTRENLRGDAMKDYDGNIKSDIELVNRIFIQE